MQSSFFLFDTKSKSSKSACKHELKKALITGKDESNGSYYIKIINFNNISGDIGTEHNSKWSQAPCHQYNSDKKFW